MDNQQKPSSQTNDHVKKLSGAKAEDLFQQKSGPRRFFNANKKNEEIKSNEQESAFPQSQASNPHFKAQGSVSAKSLIEGGKMLKPKLNQLTALDVTYQSAEPCGLWIWHINSSLAQKFELKKVDQDIYTIMASCSGLFLTALELEESSEIAYPNVDYPKPPVKVMQLQERNNNSQRWKITNPIEGYYRITSILTNESLCTLPEKPRADPFVSKKYDVVSTKAESIQEDDLWSLSDMVVKEKKIY